MQKVKSFLPFFVIGVCLIGGFGGRQNAYGQTLGLEDYDPHFLVGPN